MDKVDIILIALVFLFLAIIATAGICSDMWDTKHELWLGDEIKAIPSEFIDHIIETPDDSLIVTHPRKPGIIGYIIFKPKE